MNIPQYAHEEYGIQYENHDATCYIFMTHIQMKCRHEKSPL